jgi:hypothetical protein
LNFGKHTLKWLPVKSDWRNNGYRQKGSHKNGSKEQNSLWRVATKQLPEQPWSARISSKS